MSIEQHGSLREQKERPRFSHILVYRVRHPDTEYKEQTTPGGITEEISDITEKGRAQMRETLQNIVNRLSPTKDTDLIWVASSQRKRARDAAAFLKEGLQEEGFPVVASEAEFGGKDKKWAIQKRIRNFDFYGSTGEALDTQDPEYSEVFNQLVSKLKVGSTQKAMGEQQYMKAYPKEFPEAETFDSVQKRARNQLTFLYRVAKKIQPEIEKKFGKRLVIIQVEHTESLEDFYSSVSNGEFASERNMGPEKGEAVELAIPIEDNNNTLEVNFLHRKAEKKVNYNYLKREFEI